MTLIYLVAAWSLGILAAAASSARTGEWLALALAAALLGVLLRGNRAQRLAMLYVVLLALGAARYAWSTRALPADHIVRWLDTGFVTLVGHLSAPPDVRDYHVNLRLAVESVRQGGVSAPARGTVLVQGPRTGVYEYGDRLSIRGELITPPEFDTFSYRDYLARRGIHGLVSNAAVAVVAHDTGRPWLSALYDLKTRAQYAIDRMLPSPQAPLLSGILLGEEQGIDAEVREAFTRTGTSHVIAISGANVVIILRALIGLLAPLGTRRARWLAISGVALYAVFVGADATVVRAAIMGSVALLALQTGRKAHGLTTLTFAAWVMTLGNPHVLWDVGFQLSVAATVGLILFADDGTRLIRALLERLVARDTARRVAGWLSEPLAVTVAAQMTTTPLIMVHFGQVSLIALLANVLIIPVQPYIMIGGWLTLLASLVSAGLGTLVAWSVWLPLSYTLTVVRQLARVEWASASVAVGGAQVGFFYVLLLSAAWFRIQHPDDRRAVWSWARQRVPTLGVAAAAAVLAVLVWAVALTQPDGRLHVWFLDVGEGHAVLIETPGGAQILVDGGESPSRLRRAVGDALPFWDRTLDVMIATQTRQSAASAPLDLLRHYRAAALLGPRGAWPEQPAVSQAVVQALQAGWRAEVDDGVVVEALAAPAGSGADSDVHTLLLRVRYGDASFLIVPASGEDALLRLLERGGYAGSAVLELPAQGTRTASLEPLVQAVHPQVVVVELAAGNRAGQPVMETVEGLSADSAIALFRTDHHGTVEMVTDGRTLWVYTRR